VSKTDGFENAAARRIDFDRVNMQSGSAFSEVDQLNVTDCDKIRFCAEPPEPKALSGV
jgi:hypothetical protein